MSTAAVILAAGQGKRMRSSLPKVLHPVADLPLVGHVVRLALERKCDPVVVVVDPQGQRTREALTALFPGAPLLFAVQEQARGTGDAVRSGLSAIPAFSGRVLILSGDVPLLRDSTVRELEEAIGQHDLAFLTAEIDEPSGYGRIVREGGRPVRIVEHRDASRAELGIREVNVGCYLCDATLLRETIEGLSTNNAQGEQYLTDIVPKAAAGRGAVGVRMADPEEMRGVNNQAELAQVDAILRRRLIAQHQERGVRFRDPMSTFIGRDVEIAEDVVVGPFVQLIGRVRIGRGARIEGPTVIKDCVLGEAVQVEAFCHFEGARVGNGVKLGPYARLRPEAELADDVHIGNFVEVKKSKIGKGSKANHLAYLGDSEIGSGVNVGAGTITCNYDGVAKHKTLIGDGVFVGSNSTLVAPLSIGAGAYVAAGSTLTKEVAPDALGIGRARQENRDGYAKKLRDKMKASKKG